MQGGPLNLRAQFSIRRSFCCCVHADVPRQLAEALYEVLLSILSAISTATALALPRPPPLNSVRRSSAAVYMPLQLAEALCQMRLLTVLARRIHTPPTPPRQHQAFLVLVHFAMCRVSWPRACTRCGI